MGKLTGWGIKGKPFTKEQFLKSHIRQKLFKGEGYKEYMKDVKETLRSRNKKLKRALKTAMN